MIGFYAMRAVMREHFKKHPELKDQEFSTVRKGKASQFKKYE